jgi:sugar-phosphatase
MSFNKRSYQVEAILFDMDGTIVDSSIPVHKAWKAWGDSAGIDFRRVLAVMHGRRAIETMQMLAPDLPQPETADRFLEVEALDVEGIVEIPGAGAFIASLPAGRWGVVTSATQSMARDRMRAAGLPIPEVLVSADMVSRGKPDPECFLRASELLGVAPGKCLAFEDAPAGIAAAKAAGMVVVGVETNYTGAELGVDQAIPDFCSAATEFNSDDDIRVTLHVDGLD